MGDEVSISIGPLKIWVSGRQFPDHQVYWDGNWLACTALCEDAGSRVQASGAFIHLGELKKWRADLQEFHSKLEGSVELPTIEPTLGIKIKTRKSSPGHLDCEVDITGEQITKNINTCLILISRMRSALAGDLSHRLSAFIENF
jgi:hypothetical protein